MAGFDVVITGFRLNAREPAPKALSRVLGITLEEAKACAKRFPYVALLNASEAHAEELRAKLEEAGARVSVEARELPEVVAAQTESELAPIGRGATAEAALREPPYVELPAASVPVLQPLTASPEIKVPPLVASFGVEPVSAEPAKVLPEGSFRPRRPAALPDVSLSLAPSPSEEALTQDASGMLLHTERDLQRDIGQIPVGEVANSNDGFLSLPESEEELRPLPDLVSAKVNPMAESGAELLPELAELPNVPPLSTTPRAAVETGMEPAAPAPALRPALETLPLYESLVPTAPSVYKPAPQAPLQKPAPAVVARPSDAHELKPYALGDLVLDLGAPAKARPAQAQVVAAAPPPVAAVNDFDSTPPAAAALELDYTPSVRDNSAPSGSRDLTSPKKNNVTEAFGMGAGRDLDDSLNPEMNMPAPEIEIVSPTTTVSKNNPEKTADLWLVSCPKDSATGARVLAQVVGLPLDRAMRLVQTAPCLVASGWKLSKIKSAGSPLIAAGFELKVRASVSA